MIFSFAEALGGKILSLLRSILPVRWLYGVGHSGKIINSCSRSGDLKNPSKIYIKNSIENSTVKVSDLVVPNKNSSFIYVD